MSKKIPVAYQIQNFAKKVAEKKAQGIEVSSRAYGRTTQYMPKNGEKPVCALCAMGVVEDDYSTNCDNRDICAIEAGWEGYEPSGSNYDKYLYNHGVKLRTLFATDYR